MSQEKKSRARVNRGTREPPPPAEQPVAALSRQLDEPKWHERAAFQVAFDSSVDSAGQPIWQTRAYHEEADGRTVWPGIAGAALMTWMRERAGLPSEAQAEPAAESAPMAAADPMPAEAGASIGLSVGALDVLEIPAEAQAGGEVIGGRLCAQVTFDLSGPMAYLATAALRPYTIQVLALDIQSAAAVPLASLRCDLRPELLGYAETLDLDVPPVGSYQLIANVVLPDDDIAAVALGPVLHVVP